MSIAGRAVFFSELDDDYQKEVDLKPDALLSRLVCYYLLAPRVILHPAYIWQSKETHTLVNTAGRELFRPPFTELELGLHQTIEEYMAERIRQLSIPGGATPELRSYESFGPELEREARDLSIRFDTSRRRQVSTYSRDQEFRRLLDTDLRVQAPEGGSLGALLTTVAIAGDRIVQTDLGDKLQDFVARSQLVSVDTILQQLQAEGYDDLAHSTAVRRRLLSLYYETYCDADIVIPGTKKLRLGSIINPYDTEIFWMAMVEAFGDEFQLLAEPRTKERLLALRELRESHDWEYFKESYLKAIEDAEEAIRSQPDEVLARIRQLHPGRSRQFIWRKLWLEHKTSVSTFMFGMLSSIPGAFLVTNPVSLGIEAFAVAGTAVTGRGLVKRIRLLNCEFQNLGPVRVRETVRQHVNRVLREQELSK